MRKKPTKSKKLDEWHRERTLFYRDLEGELIPRNVPLLGEPETEIVIRPLTLYELDFLNFESILNPNLSIIEYVRESCIIQPKITEWDLVKKDYYDKIMLTVLFECGYEVIDEEERNRAKVKSTSKKSLKRKLYELINQDEKRAQQAVLLHELGYTYFNIPKLTVQEVNLLVLKKLETDKKRYGSAGKKGPSVKGRSFGKGKR